MEQVRRRATKRPPLSCRIAAGSPMRRTVSGRRRGCFGPIAWPNGVAPELVGSGRFRVAHGFFPGPHRPAGCVRERSRRSRTVIRGPSCVADRAWRMCVAARTLQFAIRNSQLATRNSQLATRNSQLAIRGSQRATRNAQRATRGPRPLALAASTERYAPHRSHRDSTRSRLPVECREPNSAAPHWRDRLAPRNGRFDEILATPPSISISKLLG
ncbi:hypothetical protein DM82_5905 [Burkholderia oklahomensis]|uniref:Uncharacterized protein n=1 Tax=Burkholderia oklahomensis TaxID=342113 RepID=A0AAI8BEF4_9BURK|nr:hypothetical protein DM82_5905 [Burkholderia oklahomensis]